ncbi:MAG: restriction endonuclease subunit S [Bacteroidales bacterium]|jgi:type I restriction enzyme S subunit|nr:restriction endonuclease subunit S [Bacteroidales bacterium]
MIAKQLKDSILQMAVQGKLVPQDPNDEPASILLEKIRAEKWRLIKEGKIKKDKQESIIFRGSDNLFYEKFNDGKIKSINNEIPFEIPQNWEWVRLENICNFGECKNVESCDIEQDEWVLDLEDIEKETGKLLVRKKKKEVDSASTKHRFMKDSVLYSKLRPYLNKVIIADFDGYCTSEILPLIFYEHAYNKYAQVFLMSPHFVEYAKRCSYGTKMPRLGTRDGKSALFPLPPLAEQKRIVEKIEVLMNLVGSIPNDILQKAEGWNNHEVHNQVAKVDS